MPSGTCVLAPVTWIASQAGDAPARRRRRLGSRWPKSRRGLRLPERRRRTCPGGRATARPGGLLLVDDSVDNRRLVQLYLKALPYALDTAADGREAGRLPARALRPGADGRAHAGAGRAWRRRGPSGLERQQGRAPTPVVALTAASCPRTSGRRWRRAATLTWPSRSRSRSPAGGDRTVRLAVTGRARRRSWPGGFRPGPDRVAGVPPRPGPHPASAGRRAQGERPEEHEHA